MFGNVTALVGLHVTGKYRDESMMHTCSRHAAWVPHRTRVYSPIRCPASVAYVGQSRPDFGPDCMAKVLKIFEAVHSPICCPANVAQIRQSRVSSRTIHVPLQGYLTY